MRTEYPRFMRRFVRNRRFLYGPYVRLFADEGGGADGQARA